MIVVPVSCGFIFQFIYMMKSLDVDAAGLLKSPQFCRRGWKDVCFCLVLLSCQATDDIREDASMVVVCQLHLCVKAKSATEGFPVVSSDGHILTRTDLADVGRKVDGEPLMSSKAE